jgi:hypothetical protein
MAKISKAQAGKSLKPGQRLTESGKVVSGKEAKKVTSLEKGMVNELMKRGPSWGDTASKKAAPKKSMKMGGRIKKAQEGKTVRDSEKMSGGKYKLITKSKSTPSGIEREIKAKRTLKGVLQGAPKASVLNTTIKQKQKPAKFDIPSVTMRKGGKVMLKRADGSYSQRGLWDNIRAAKGSGKKPTAAMLKQEKKIKAKSK